MKKKSNKKRRRLNKKKVLNVFLIFVVIGLIIYYISNIRIRNIIITGNTYTKDYEIIEISGLKDYPKLFEISSNTIKDKIDDLELIDNVKVTKNPLGIIYIKVEEVKPLYININNKVIASNGNEIDNNNYLGLPTLTNYIEDNIKDELVKALNKLDNNILTSISEITYNPSVTATGEVIDETRFTFIMNDGNTAIVDTLNIEKFNSYLNVVNTTMSNMGQDKKGTYVFDSATDKVIFESYDSQKTEVSIDGETTTKQS